MPSNLAFVKHRLQLHLNGSADVTGASDVIVHWIESTGGELDEVTSAIRGGSQLPLSGVLRAFGHEEPARTVLRQYSEIQAGDLILEVAQEGVVTLFSGQPLSGVVSLDDLANKGVRFEWGGKMYTQASIGEGLAQAWNVVVQNQRLYRSLLLRLAT